MNKPTRLKGRLATLILVLCAALLARPCAAAPGQWSPTGNLTIDRQYHTATLLPSGKVLVAGGWDGSSVKLATAELYDPATGIWSGTGSMHVARIWHSTTLLPNGLVLVAGGASDAGAEATAELYDPATGTWSFTGNLQQARSLHSSALLANGKVLVADSISGTKSAELFDPATGTWTATGSLSVLRKPDLTALPLTVLSNGKALLEGGFDIHGESIKTAELYDPATGLWSFTGSMNVGREQHTATLLPNGMVLVAAGYNTGLKSLASAELYDPATGVWTNTGNLLQDRYNLSATLLPDGTVLVAGGASSFSGEITETELYDPATGAWRATGSLNHSRFNHRAVLLPSGMVLVAAGGPVANTAELYDSGTTVAATQVSGRGSIAGQGGTATFSLQANDIGGVITGSVTFKDAGAGVSMKKAKVRTLTFDGNSATLGGNGRLGDGTNVTYSVTTTDGSPDTFSISLSNGYSAGGTLTSGDIAIQ